MTVLILLGVAVVILCIWYCGRVTERRWRRIWAAVLQVPPCPPHYCNVTGPTGLDVACTRCDWECHASHIRFRPTDGGAWEAYCYVDESARGEAPR